MVTKVAEQAANQLLGRIYDEASDSIKTTLVNAEVSIDVNALTDSIKIGDGAGTTATITDNSGKKSLDVNVTDIAISHTDDSIKIGDGTRLALVTAAQALKIDGSAVTHPVSGTFWQSTQPVSASQSGTWTVQPGNTANTTAWKVDGSAVTQPVSGTFWQSTQPVSSKATTTTITGTASALNTNVIYADVSGYTTGYLLITANDDIGDVRVTYQGSVDNSTWVTLFVVDPTSSPPTTYSQTPIVQGGFNNGPASLKIRLYGRYFRARITSYTGASAVISGTLFLSAEDQTDPVAISATQLLDGSGNLVTWGQAPASNSLPVVLASDQQVTAPFYTRTDTYTATANGVVVDCSLAPVRNFSVQVTKTGAVTSWDVRLEGSLDGATFTQILQHTNVTPGDGLTTFSVTSSYPVLYFRSRAAGLVIGVGTNITATVLGVA